MARTDDSVYTLLVRVTALAQRAATELLLEAIPVDGDACASELASQLEVPTSTVTRALRRLEQSGYVTLRKGIFFDARVLRAQVTHRGDVVRSCALGFEEQIDALLVETLSPAVRAALLQGLVHMHVTLTAGLHPASSRDGTTHREDA